MTILSPQTQLHTHSALGVPIAYGATTKMSSGTRPGRMVSITPVELAQDYRGYPKGTRLGTLQTWTYKGRVEGSSTCSLHGYGVLGHDTQWLVTEFKENEGGDRKARFARIQPKKAYRVAQTFGYLPHGIYEPADTLVVQTVSEQSIVVTPVRNGVKGTRQPWDRKDFECLLETRALQEL